MAGRGVRIAASVLLMLFIAAEVCEIADAVSLRGEPGEIFKGGLVMGWNFLVCKGNGNVHCFGSGCGLKIWWRDEHMWQ